MYFPCPHQHIDDTPLDDPQWYISIVRKLIYLPVTWLDITCVVNQLSQHVVNPTISNMQITNHYIKGSPSTELFMFVAYSAKPVAFFDSNWVASPATCTPSLVTAYSSVTTSWVSKLGNNALSRVLLLRLNIVPFHPQLVVGSWSEAMRGLNNLFSWFADLYIINLQNTKPNTQNKS